MSDERDFVVQEAAEIEKAIDLIKPLLAKDVLDQYESIALGTLLQNVYTGIESILRYELLEQGVKIAKTENWHKDLLQTSLKNELIELGEFDTFSTLLLFRHRHIHGYGHMLDSARLTDIAAPVPGVCTRFLSHTKNR